MGPWTRHRTKRRRQAEKCKQEGGQNPVKQRLQAQNGDAMKCGPVDQATDQNGKDRDPTEKTKEPKPRQNKGPRPKRTTQRCASPWTRPKTKRGRRGEKVGWTGAKTLFKQGPSAQKGDSGMLGPMGQATDEKGKARGKSEIGRGLKPRQNKGSRPISAAQCCLEPCTRPRSKRGRPEEKARLEGGQKPVKTKVPGPKGRRSAEWAHGPNDGPKKEGARKNVHRKGAKTSQNKDVRPQRSTQ